MTLGSRVALIAVLTATVGCSRKPADVEQRPTPAAPPVTTPGRSVEIFSWNGVPTSLAARRGAPPAGAAVLSRLFPRSLPGADRCPEAPGTLEQARAQGWIVPQVASHAEGAFSRAGAAELLLAVRVGECGATHAEGWGTRRLVLWAGEQVVQEAELQGRLAGAGDLDGDGRSELLIERGGTNQGITTTSLQVARLTPQGLAVVAELGVVYEGSCGAQKPEGEEVSLVTAVVRDGVLDFELRKEQRPCKGG
jgi:hypothetical protein